MGLENLMKEVSTELEKLVSTKTVVGDPIEAAGATIIPVSRVSFGFGSGGGEGKKGATEEGFGGGGGAGARIEPVAFIVISEGDVKLLTMSGGSNVDKFLEAMPDVLSKMKSLKKTLKKEGDEESPETEESKE
ncbi:sporulation protein YtfJ [Methanohalophilus levihalophilus]|uniref:GerW family sporulation protein n=1 Tax=Methanohalophilus levihalophilus TaxID=1431282 RepID=UPI001AE44746|nr:spore germination protein GerW family protein [Methanohalophilus levihalophilus]MBP2030002.1 sporulation protein YtfJ [Methanohalophilus levihalophilus]